MSLVFETVAINVGRWLGGKMIGTFASDAVLDAIVKTTGIRITPLEPIDLRLAKIEVARASLSSALGAIDELKGEAEKNAAQVETLRTELDRVSEAHAIAHEELINIRELAKLDAATVKKVMGVPTAKAVWIERGFSFFIGILASVAASWIYSSLT